MLIRKLTACPEMTAGDNTRLTLMLYKNGTPTDPAPWISSRILANR